MRNKIEVLVADDHTLFRSGIVKLLSGYRDITVVGEAEDGEKFYEEFCRLNPDVGLVDISMPKLSGTEAVKKIKRNYKNAKILFLSMFDSEEYAYSCLAAGGCGLINKNIMEEELINAIRTVYAGGKYFGRGLSEQELEEIILRYESVYQKGKAAPQLALSKRELEILKMIGDGYTSAEIANELSISLKTVDSHRSSLMRKLNLSSLTELIRFAVQYSMNAGY
jgi:two-component system response regulator NreC